MRYRWRPRAGRTLTVDALDGGLQLHRDEKNLPASAISRCTNLLWRRGALTARDGWRCTEAVTGQDGALFIAPDTHLQNGRAGRRFIERVRDGESEVRRIGTVWQDGSVQSEQTELDADNVSLLCDIGDGKALVLADGRALVHADGQGVQNAPVYIPTVRINGRGCARMDAEPAEAGVFWEEFNLLTPAWKETFTTDGAARYFYLVRQGVEAAVTLQWTDGNGVTFTHSLPCGQKTETIERGDGMRLVYHRQLGAVALEGYPNNEVVPSAAGFAGNLTVTVQPQGGADGRLLGMRRAVWYGGQASGVTGGTRLFLGGNPDHPNLVCWSAVNRPDYMPENNYLYVGGDGPVTAMARQSDKLILFKQREIYALQYAQGDISSQQVLQGVAGGVQAQSAYFTLQPIHSRLGAISPESVVLCGGRLLFLSAEGQVCRLSGLNALSESNVHILSEAVAPLLQGMDITALQRAAACECGGNYLLEVGGQVLVLCGGDENFSHLASGKSGAWYRWEQALGSRALALLGAGEAAVRIGCGERYLRTVHLLGGTADGVVLADGSVYPRQVEYAFQSAFFRLGAPHRRGCAERVWLHLGAGTPTLGCANEWGSLAATENGGQLYPQRCDARYFAVSARGKAPFAAYGLTIRYRETGTVK